MTDLDALIEAVEAGTIPSHDLDAFIPWRGLDTQTNDSHDAYRGSLDAAKRLHEALLPGWGWDVCDDGEARVFEYTSSADSAPFDDYIGVRRDNPARAWLLAILRADKALQSIVGKRLTYGTVSA